MTKKLPQLRAALLCDSVLEEKDGTISAIRIIDQIHLVMPQMDEDAFGALAISALISVYASDATRGRHRLSIRQRGLDGALSEVKREYEIAIGEKSAAMNLILKMNVLVKTFGVHRLEVFWDDEHLATIPFTLVEAAETPSASPPVPPTPSGSLPGPPPAA